MRDTQYATFNAADSFDHTSAPEAALDIMEDVSDGLRFHLSKIPEPRVSTSITCKSSGQKDEHLSWHANSNANAR